MKKLFVLATVILIVGLLAGCWLLPESKLISITVDPESMDLGDPIIGTILNTQEAIESVTANYEDETSGDVKLTDCEYCTYDCQVAKVNAEGLVTAVDKGKTAILVSYTEGNLWTGRITETDIVIVTVE